MYFLFTNSTKGFMVDVDGNCWGLFNGNFNENIELSMLMDIFE